MRKSSANATVTKSSFDLYPILMSLQLSSGKGSNLSTSPLISRSRCHCTDFADTHVDCSLDQPPLAASPCDFQRCLYRCRNIPSIYYYVAGVPSSFRNSPFKTILPMVSSISVYIFQISQPMRFHPELETRTPASFSEAKCSDTANLVWQCQVHFSVRPKELFRFAPPSDRPISLLFAIHSTPVPTTWYRSSSRKGGVSVVSVLSVQF
jgi:hypothetical protein